VYIMSHKRVFAYRLVGGVHRDLLTDNDTVGLFRMVFVLCYAFWKMLVMFGVGWQRYFTHMDVQV
jgi:hypothetical protein